jgi:two-component system cell cycle response regulator DivK
MTPPDAAPSPPPLVLVVEDYQDARDMYVEYLRFAGFRVAEARNGLEALDRAFALVPDVVLMDLALPRMDGWEATRRLKTDPRTSHIPVVALTGHALAGHADGARQAGCDAFVRKPCLPDVLVAEIRRVLAAGPPSSGRAGPEDPAPGVDQPDGRSGPAWFPRRH